MSASIRNIVFMQDNLEPFHFFVALVLPLDDGQWWQKHVKAMFYIKLVALDEPCCPFMYPYIKLNRP
jgi:hypothetical protein